MKRKLIVTLVATALELYAAAATAQVGSCEIVGTSKSASNATPVTSGPMNPATGFPEYVTDSTGLTLQRCLDPNLCFFDPVNPDDPLSLQIQSGGESFWWASDVFLADQAGRVVFRLGMAAEAAFLGETPDGKLIDGTQFPFLRLRYVFDAPADGTYTLTYPYGTEKFDVVGATGNRDIFVTYDRGLTANSTTIGGVGPFLIGEGYPQNGFMGNGGDVGALQIRASGGPCFVGPDGFHTVTLTGVGTDGVTPIDFGGGQTALTTDLFVIQGHVYDGRVQTPINATRTTYSRSATGAGQVEAFAASTTAAGVTVIDGPTVPLGAGRIPTAVALDHSVVSPAGATAAIGINSTAVGVTDASALPPIVTVTASDTASVSATGAQMFDPTALNLQLVDFVDIATADFDPASNTLSVSATSGDKRDNPLLTVRGLGAIDPATSQFTLTTEAPPAIVHVDSAAGGSATAQVRVIAAVAPTAPSAPQVGTATARTVTLTWTHEGNNESGFRIYTVDAVGVRTQVGSAGVNATSATVSGLAVSTSYTFVVEAFNSVGTASSETVTGTTLALPAAPATASFAPSTTAQNVLDVIWSAVADATEYQVYRRTGATGAFTLVTTTASTNYADLGRAANTNYAYQIVALRNIAGVTDASAPTQTAAFTTVTAPTSPTLRTPALAVSTVNGVTSVTVNWNDRATNETGYQVYRRTAATGTTPAGNFVAVSGILSAKAGGGTTAANAMSFTDAAVPAGVFQYRVDVSNWAGAVQSPVSASVLAGPPVLNAPTNLTATTGTRPTLNWVDNSSGETGYRVIRRAQTVDAATGLVTAGAATTFNIPTANLTTYRETVANTLPTQQLVGYEVMAMDGTTVGASASRYAITSALPTASRPVATANGAGSLSITWPVTGQAHVSGYELQRCAGATCTNFAKVPGTVVNSDGTVDGRATAGFIDTGLTSGTTYRYRLRTVGVKGSSLVGAFSPISVNRVAP
ncbi:fibronectin type III domain-containing protein [Sphaerotilus mobilis]|uniref:Fibronectin type III domain protein n=1 Tax=Sphaerotilus mobilis TaxID=47994 RepID=A0A4Q7LQW4_9BURK|nr:fibronectin type III domain-containing protein [Sphaerotilus mobilis]RZS57094.1 fibronectin type III domain protein [Sphaerotilus mobilis]